MKILPTRVNYISINYTLLRAMNEKDEIKKGQNFKLVLPFNFLFDLN
ncbi:hypothetical protein HMPREF0548_1352 [Lactobacillus ultunensis DSM 16047]|uniref:Uncharacterized protein n=1 Tax=Lactobacillus ultunensis DSM 16047 TaxID=525365 RepID=C2ENV6_9LACO|nr:hypothetical protein HMPREF0548_1352 [Lactobacillus ultunensis DSM 16047]